MEIISYSKVKAHISHRQSVMRNIVTSLLREEKIETTQVRAKELKKIADKMITLGKKGDLHSQRQAMAYITDEDVVYKLFHEIAPRYEDRQGGYTRVVKMGNRRGDSAPMALVELV